MIEKAIEKICQQQKGIEDTAAYCVGEQLKDIIRTAPGAAELVFKDLDVKEMSIIECEKKIKALADRRHNKNRGNFAFVSPKEADGIIREFYGIPDAEFTQENTVEPNNKDSSAIIDLDSFL